jgi:hypothetical protein
MFEKLQLVNLLFKRSWAKNELFIKRKHQAKSPKVHGLCVICSVTVYTVVKAYTNKYDFTELNRTLVVADGPEGTRKEYLKYKFGNGDRIKYLF